MTAQLEIDLDISAKQNLLNLIIQHNPQFNVITEDMFTIESIVNITNKPESGKNGNSNTKVTIRGIEPMGLRGTYTFYYNRVNLNNLGSVEYTGTLERKLSYRDDPRLSQTFNKWIQPFLDITEFYKNSSYFAAVGGICSMIPNYFLNGNFSTNSNQTLFSYNYSYRNSGVLTVSRINYNAVYTIKNFNTPLSAFSEDEGGYNEIKLRELYDKYPHLKDLSVTDIIYNYHRELNKAFKIHPELPLVTLAPTWDKNINGCFSFTTNSNLKAVENGTSYGSVEISGTNAMLSNGDYKTHMYHGDVQIYNFYKDKVVNGNLLYDGYLNIYAYSALSHITS